MTISSFILLVVFLYCVWFFITILRIPEEDYNRHRELILYPENDILGNTTTSMSMGQDGKIQFKKRASIGATKLLLHKAWN